MPGALLDANATVLCAHGAKAQPAAPNPRVIAGGAPTVAVSSPFLVSGCPNVVPAGSPFPCVTASFVTSALRVKSGAQPLLLIDGSAIAAPTGTPLTIVAAQARAKGQ